MHCTFAFFLVLNSFTVPSTDPKLPPYTCQFQVILDCRLGLHIRKMSVARALFFKESTQAR